MNQYLFLRTLAQSQLCKVKLACDIRDQARYYVRANSEGLDTCVGHQNILESLAEEEEGVLQEEGARGSWHELQGSATKCHDGDSYNEEAVAP